MSNDEGSTQGQEGQEWSAGTVAYVPKMRSALERLRQKLFDNKAQISELKACNVKLNDQIEVLENSPELNATVTEVMLTLRY